MKKLSIFFFPLYTLFSFSLVFFSFAHAMEVEANTILRITPAEIDGSEGIIGTSGILRGTGPFKLINPELLKQKSHPDIRDLNLSSPSGKGITKYCFIKDHIDVILSSFSHLTSLDLSHNDFSFVGAEVLMNSLKNNGNLSILTLSSTNFCKKQIFRLLSENPSQDYMSQLMDIAISNPTEFVDQYGEEGSPFMSMMALTQKIDVLPILHFSGEKSTMNYEMGLLSEVLQQNKVLIEIDLSGNSIQTTDVQVLLEGLKNNFTLRNLKLDRNRIDESGIMLLKEFVINRPNLKISFENQKTENDHDEEPCIIF